MGKIIANLSRPFSRRGCATSISGFILLGETGFEDKFESSDTIIGWVCSERLFPLIHEEKLEHFTSACCRLYVMCEKLCLAELMDEVVDHLRDAQIVRRLLYNVECNRAIF